MVGGGDGGQRRELNVLKRLRISGALLILLWKCDDLAVWTSAEKDERNDDTYSGPTARLIFAIFSLPLGVWSDVHKEHQITRG